MKVKRTPIFLIASLAASGALGLEAQEGYSYLFKLRAGLTAGDIQKTHSDNKLGSIGAEIKREMFGAGRALSAEVTWEYVTGRHYETDMFPSMGLNPRWSYDDRKEYGTGINLRFAYNAPLSVPFLNTNDDLEWFAGLGIDRFKVRSEVRYTFSFTNSQNPGLDNSDGNVFLREESQLVPGFFAGLKYKLNQDIGFELSLRNFGMWHMDYVPASYNTKAPLPRADYGTGTTSTGTSRGFALEFAITLHL
jgi:hypothetical protein